MALALYRKYRPRTFAEVIGQEHVTEPLSQALRSGRLHHAYLFSGPRGCGKTSSARILARSLNCEQGPTPEPCGVCASCRSLMNDGTGSIDVIEIDAASHGGVDDARDLREKAFFAPASSRYKIYVIDEAHMVSSAGFNALLKLVEEPPDYVKFIFATTEPEKVLGTIRSRTHHYPFRLIPPAVLRPYLQQLTEAEGVHVEPAVLPLVVRAGGGSARDSLSVLDQLIAGAGPEGVSYTRAVSLLGVTDASLIDEMCDALAAGDGAAAYSTIDRVAEAGHDPRRFASDLLERLRDLIILQQVPDAVTKGLIDGPADQLEAMSAQAARLGPATLSRCADIVHTGLVDMRGTTAPRLLLELITARMLLPGAEDSTGVLLQRLERMERRLTLSGDDSVRAEPAPATPQPSAAPVASAPAAGGPAVPAGGSAAGSAGGGGLSAARAAAAAASRRSAPGTTARPGGPGGDVAQAAPAHPTPEQAPHGQTPTPASPDAMPAGASSAGGRTGSSLSVAASAAGDPAAGSSSNGGVPVGEPELYDDEPPPWDDEPDVDPYLAEEPRPAPQVPAARSAESTQPVTGSAAVEIPGSAVAAAGSAAAVAPEPAATTATAEPAATAEPEPAATATAEPEPAATAEPEPAATAEPEPAAAATAEPERAAPAAAAAPGRRAEPRGVLPDAPEEPGAAAVADVPGQLTVAAVREVWPEIVATIKRQPNGKVAGPMAAGAVVRALDGDTVVLVFQFANHADRIARESALVTDALYEALGGRWSIRCEVGGRDAGERRDVGEPPSRGREHRDAPAAGGRGPERNDAPRSSATRAAPRAASGAQQPSAARGPRDRRQESEAPPPADDDWPEPARPGGLAPAVPEPAAEAEHDDEDWPEVRPIGVPDSEPDPPPAAVLAAETGAPRDEGRPAPATRLADGSAAVPGAGLGGRVTAAAGSAGPVGGGLTAAAGSTGPAGDDMTAPGGYAGAARGGLTVPAGGVGSAGGGVTVPAGGVGPAGGGVTVPAGGVGPAGGGVTVPGSVGRAGGGVTAPAGSAGSASGGSVTASAGSPPPVGGGVTASAGSGSAGGGVTASTGSAGSVVGGTVTTPAVAGGVAKADVGSAGSASGGGVTGHNGRNAAPGRGLAAARAAAAGARNAAARQGTAKPAAAPASWSDGSPTEEAPYDPDYDGSPAEGAAYEGFDPGDEPLDDVIDEKTARESSEQQAVRLLQDVLGAEKIGEA